MRAPTVPLHLLQNLEIAGDNNSEVIITNSALQVDGMLIVGDDSGEAASVRTRLRLGAIR